MKQTPSAGCFQDRARKSGIEGIKKKLENPFADQSHPMACGQADSPNYKHQSKDDLLRTMLDRRPVGAVPALCARHKGVGGSWEVLKRVLWVLLKSSWEVLGGLLGLLDGKLKLLRHQSREWPQKGTPTVPEGTPKKKKRCWARQNNVCGKTHGNERFLKGLLNGFLGGSLGAKPRFMGVKNPNPD